MLKEDVRPSSLVGIKRRARQITKTVGVPHTQALNIAAKSASFENYEHARRRLLVDQDHRLGGHRIFLTMYWENHETHACGRESLEVNLSQPFIEICAKSEMRLVRALCNMRLAAQDHLVRDALAPSQEFARSQLCQTVRAIRFMEATGLRPCNFQRGEIGKKNLDAELPRADHSSEWYDPSSGQFILVDEPYTEPVVSRERADWAKRNKWLLRASTWPGIYFPRLCGFFVATCSETSFDFEALMRKIDGIEPPIVAENWIGVSELGHQIFVSPLANTPQDRRRAKAKGTVIHQPSKLTIPQFSMWGSERRRPRAAMPIAEHQETGRMIKAVLQSAHKPWSVNRRMDRLRSRLEDWMAAEIGPNEPQGFDLFDVYYGGVSENDPYVAKATSSDGLKSILNGVKRKLQHHYPDCAPLRSQTNRIDTALRSIGR